MTASVAGRFGEDIVLVLVKGFRVRQNLTECDYFGHVLGGAGALAKGASGKPREPSVTSSLNRLERND